MRSPQKRPMRSPQTEPMRSPQKRPMRSPQKRPMLSPQKEPMRLPQTEPMWTLEMDPMQSPQTGARAGAPQPPPVELDAEGQALREWLRTFRTQAVIKTTRVSPPGTP